MNAKKFADKVRDGLVRKRFGLDGAQVVLGHKNLEVTQVYAEVDRARAAEIAAALG